MGARDLLDIEAMPAHEPVLGAVAWDDPPTRRHLLPRRGVRLAIAVLAATGLLLSLSGTALAGLGVALLVALAGGGLVVSVLQGRDRRRLASVLRRAPWQLVNVVVVSDLLGRGLTRWERFFARGQRRGGVHHGEKVVAIVEPATGEVLGTWLPFMPISPWPGLDVRSWAWLAVRPDGRVAAIAPPDRSRLVGLRRGPRFLKAIHERAWTVLRDIRLDPSPGGASVRPGDFGVQHPVGEPERWPNRPMRTSMRIAIVAVFAGLAVLAGINDTLAHRRKVDHRQELVAQGIEAHARVVEHRDGGKGQDTLTIELLDGPFAGYRGSRGVDRGPRAGAGRVVTVHHDPRDVDDLVIDGYDQDVRATGWALGAVTTVLALFLWARHRPTRAPTSLG